LQSENNLISCFNYVSQQISYITDRQNYRFEEHWAFLVETLQRGMGDCEDTTFLLASLLLASGIDTNIVRVAIGLFQNQGHAWVEVNTTDLGWIILETTSNDYYQLGRNIHRIQDGYSCGYRPMAYVYNTFCIRAQ
jgi:transglutaminase-like putative cysteine protease